MKFPKTKKFLVLLFMLTALALTTSYASTQAPKFLSQQTIPVDGAQQVVSADLNHDGFPDFAVAGSPGFTVILSDGQGGYQLPITYKVKNSASAFAIAIADMNNDGFPDIVVAINEHFGGVEVFLNNGSGIFPNGPKVFTAGYPTSIALGDFRGDGKQDVAVTDYQGNVGVLLGNGDGTLQPEVFYPMIHGGPGEKIVVGDVNNDGKLDLVATNNHFNLFLGNGDGTFQPATEITSFNDPFTLYDVNGDGSLDIVAIDRMQGLVVLLNQGNGTFGHFIISNSNGIGGSLALGDFNGDGKVDVALSGGIMLGEGNGYFHPPAVRYTSFGGSLLAVDFNGDGKLDVVGVTELSGSDEMLITLGYGNGGMAAPLYFAAPGPWFQANQMALGDFNNDGKLDVAAFENPEFNTPYVGIFLGNGNGTFQPSLPAFQAVGFTDTAGIATGDFNHDGKLDIVVWNSVFSSGTSPGLVSVFLGNGDGTFQSAITVDAGFVPAAMAVGDFNHDGNLDVAVADACSSLNCRDAHAEVTILLGNGDGTLRTGGTFAINDNPNSMVAADFNHDGILDLAVATSGEINILLGNGDGTFQTALAIKSVVKPFDIQAADINNDGAPDLVVGDLSNNSVDVLLGTGTGKFGAPIITPVPATGNFTIADFNGDGKLDLAVQGGNSSFFTAVYVLTGKGTGHFNSPSTVIPGGFCIQSGLLGNDTFPDIVTGGQGIVVIPNLTK